MESFGSLLSQLRFFRNLSTKDLSWRWQRSKPRSAAGCSTKRGVVFHLELESGSSSSDSKSWCLVGGGFSFLGRLTLPEQTRKCTMVNVLASWNIGWSSDTVEIVGRKCVKVLCGALWYTHHSQFKELSLWNFKGLKWLKAQLSQGRLDRHFSLSCWATIRTSHLFNQT